MIPIAPWEPDKYSLGTQTSTTLDNVLPMGNSYAPALDFVAVTAAVGTTVVGGFQARKIDGTYAIFAATQTKIYQYNQSTDAWDDVSRLVGGAYSGPPSGSYWWFVQKGDNVFAGNANDAIQLFTLASSTNFALCGGSPPLAASGAIVGDFLVLSYQTTNPYQITWGAFTSATSWTVGTDNCGSQVFADGGYVYGVGGKETGYVFQQDCVRQMVFQSSGAAVFTFQRIEGSRGCSAPFSIINVGNSSFYYGNAGFQVVSGITAQNIGLDRVNEWLKANAVPTTVVSMVGGVDPRSTRIAWAFKSISADAFQVHDRLVIYDWGRDKFTTAECSLDYLGFNGMATLGYTLEQLDSISSSLDDLEISLDSTIWQGGVPTFGGWGQSLVAESALHQLGFFNGSNMEAVLESAETQLNPPGRAFVSEVVVYGGPEESMVSVGSRETNTNNVAVNYGTETALGVTGSAPCRNSGRYHKSKIRIPAGSTWTQIEGFDYTYVAEGLR